jgi:hypothetical protein
MNTGRPPISRRLTVSAWLAATFTTTLALGCIVLEIVGPGPAATSADPEASAGGVLFVSIQAVMASAFAVLGAVVVSRQPRNPIGWLLVLIGTFFMYIAVSNELYMQVMLNTGDTSGGLAYVVWGANWAWLLCMVPAFTFLPLLFPTGRPLTPRWRVVGWIAASAVTLSFVGSAFRVGPLDGAQAVDNPLGIDSAAIGIIGGIGGFLLVPALLASFASMILRFRRSSGVERQQIKWVASAAMLLPIAATGLGLGGDASWPLILIALLIVAIAVTVAMLRYRLYDIDVVINRALVYGSLTAMLAAVYLGSVLLLQLVLETITGGSGLAVAASTLATAALFGPLRTRTQAVVDRRFFRHKYDAAQTLEQFGARLRDEVDLDALSVELRRVVGETMQPAHLSLWVSETGEMR